MLTVRVSLPTIDALEASPDPRDYSLLADDDNILIKEFSRGTVNGQSKTIEHALGYYPHFYAYGEISSGRFQIANGYNLFGDFRSYVNDTNLYIQNTTGSDKDMRYFIFYDDIPE